ncbi:hypothetical protein [Brumimicrobium aurantiacum]|uniref:Outer membrane protein beta-barrel domain-containing protein n=1 Tax=Brumimicrobium aurantiacum TaxID=1737063 RepID=A0A3E1EW81_9FLAO|nr:hypothetical protein [Brumimicrobium aurantiacum]RFC53778.1 hypothetical protein DXU93_11670 [Brumimicrobium aurantiacum]
MGNKIIVAATSLIFMLLTNVGLTQYSIGGGLSSFHGLNTDVNRFGLNAFAEVPKFSDATLLVRASYMFPESASQTADIEAIDFNTTPSKLTADVVTSTSYFAVDGGTRYYFINDYDVGFSLFAGPHIKGILSSVRVDYKLPSGINPDDYQTSSNPQQPLTGLEPQYSLLFAFGGTAGVKYQLPYRGALMFDMGVELITGLYDPYTILGREISPLSFSFNLGYRFDWY